MNRRDFLRSAGAASAGLAFPGASRLLADEGTWRTFEVTTHVEILKPLGPTLVWLPAALSTQTPYQKTLFNRLSADGGTTAVSEAKADGIKIIGARFPAGAKPVLTLTSRVMTRDYKADLSGPSAGAKANRAELEYFLRPTKLLPTDGIVKSKAMEITRASKTDLDKAHAIYEWIVDNTFRNPKTLGCGIGDIKFMLESGDLGGKCADLNALFVGLARAAGLPARDVYGIRVAPSQLGYKSLGAGSQDITKAQHCRAEVYLDSYGWVPVDPADVRKAVLEEPPGNRPLQDEMVKSARARLFGSWEMNWIAYNFAHDVALPKSPGKPLAFLMYPQAETNDGRCNCLDPSTFKYEIATKEIRRDG